MPLNDLRKLLTKTRCLFLDCDGVIFDSNEFKIRAMHEVLRDFSLEQRQRMDSYWRSNGGLSRHVKFEHFFREIARVDDPAKHCARAVERFGTLSFAGYRQVEPLPEALALARQVGADRCFVVSGADQDELVRVFRLKGIDGLFREVLGSPRSKLELVRGVLAQQEVGPQEALLIGDGARDYAACRELGIQFIYLSAYSEWTGASAQLTHAPMVSCVDSWPELLLRMGLRMPKG